MARKPAEQRVSRRITVGTPAVVKFAEEQLTGYVEVVNLNGMSSRRRASRRWGSTST